MNSLEGLMVVGLTGQTGAGKTTVCEFFKNKGFAVIDADKIAREVTAKGSPCLAEIGECFKEKVITDEGEYDRAKMAQIVFSDKNKLEMLNSICYPYITAEILERIRQCGEQNQRLILLDAPTLFESRADDFCELIISVIAKEHNRLKRIMERDNLTAEAAMNRINSQHDEHFFKKNSDFIIKNNKSEKVLKDVTEEVADRVKEYYQANFS